MNWSLCAFCGSAFSRNVPDELRCQCEPSSRPLPPSEGKTLPTLLPRPISAAIGHTLITLQQRIAQLEAELERRADVVSDQADEIALLRTLISKWPSPCANS